ncbi:MAG: DMT family transporter [Gammaproteobacteria bacterium]|nr:DMT family transporter [Sideroxydans sp.]MBU3903200.1 DMT family transporter [Gammaproteobacteria bacterium]MBU4045767.1 DMT family transporter [Gammaproteobacteria bacterium]MBU4150614.1 DMT family transporter [Gammaproteobacteria bacterium]
MLERARIIKVGRVPTKRNVVPVAGLLSGALVWGLIWYPYRVLQDAGISGALATALTYGFAMLCGVFILPRLWRERHTLGGWALLLVFSAGWANLGYVLGMLHGEVMRVLLLFYLAPVWTILFSYWLLGERLDRYGYAIVLLSLGGALVMLWKPEVGLPFPQNVSEWLGLTAGMGFALSNVVSRRSSHLSVEVKSFSLWLGTLVLTLPFLWWQGGMSQQLTTVSAGFWGLLLLMGLVLCATSFAVQYGVTHIPANRAVVLFLFELVVAALASWVLAEETMTMREWIGAALIVSATLLSGRVYTEKPAGD